MPPRALPRAVILRHPEFADLFSQSRLRWPGLTEEQTTIVMNYLEEDVYRPERPIVASTSHRQRQELHDAIILHYQGLLHRLPGLRGFCRMEIVNAAVTMPLLTFLWCVNSYVEWVEINNHWFGPILYHRIRMEEPYAVPADIQEFQSIEFLRHYSLVVAVAGILCLAFDDNSHDAGESLD
ncbi:hypothetical protein FPOA_04508 [Fusarium poae]|uniref:Uncharacterized protein n=1 Tax=Fusarium poae TaxID=36050 RepID=A0A1B8AU16_FUSPO|nr:hypothetical protein FPOA_04508 [Fusarium poae]